MAKVTVPTLSSGFGSVDLLNEALQDLAAAVENTLSRDGTTPNQMEADLDMNGYSVFNLGSSGESSGLVTTEQLEEAIAEAGSGIVVQRQQTLTATAAQTLFTLTTTSYTPGANNLAVYVNGVRKFVGVDFTETSPSSFTMLAGQSAGAKVTAATNEYLGTVTPPSVSVDFDDLYNVPDTASRWPTYTEVTGKPSTLAPSTHVHSTADITTGTGLADARRGIWVQAGTPTATRVGDLWFY